jgi:hypothetical protein
VVGGAHDRRHDENFILKISFSSMNVEENYER